MIITSGQLENTFQRIKCCGIQLVCIDVCQEINGHTATLREPTHHVGFVDYLSCLKYRQTRILHTKASLLPIASNRKLAARFRGC
ncbi:phosphoenolpyruvate carboxylase [secondary endosymbiont of Ctenarytaina eucalypti]|uniref:phosphoenolpyruvate carboxylase n=1 Tax=secondary endosymbiont of Ctenarytaina eucalypti TaxID=1199245 RepID=UPI0008FF482E